LTESNAAFGSAKVVLIAWSWSLVLEKT